VSPQNTEETQFVSSDIDIQEDQTAQSSIAAIRQGVPAGTLPPIQSEVRSNFEFLARVYRSDESTVLPVKYFQKLSSNLSLNPSSVLALRLILQNSSVSFVSKYANAWLIQFVY